MQDEIEIGTSVSGRIIFMKGRNTRYGRRVAGRIERIDWSTGEVTEVAYKAWGETALAIEDQGLGLAIGLTGRTREDPETGERYFLARRASPLRLVKPSEIDLAAYL